MTKAFKFSSNLIVSLYSALLLPCDILAQATPAPVVVRDPSAIALANKALQAVGGATALTDITLQANATYIAGSRKPGTRKPGTDETLWGFSVTDGEVLW